MRKFTLFKTMLLLCALIVGSSNVWAEDVTTTYVFTSKSWAATCNSASADWTSGKDGTGFMNHGIQVTTSTTGANGTSPVSFTNVTKIVATYNTNTSKGAGSIVAQIGSNAETTNNVAYSGSANGTTANFTTEFNYSTPQSGNVKLTVNTTTNSIYLVSVAITTSSSSTPTCATPTFSPVEGTYTSTQNVTISTTTDGATIYYTTDGNDPTTSSSVYSSAIPVSSTTTIKAMAVATGYDNSSVASATYTIKTDPALAFSSPTAEATIGQAFTAPTLTNSHSVAVTWSSSDENVATVSGGIVTLVGEGTTTITASFAGDATYIASEASYTLTVTDPSVITLWSEDFRSYSANAVPEGNGTCTYTCVNGGSVTKIYTEALAGGTAPELLVAKSGGSFTAVVPLNQASGSLKLTYKTNANTLTVTTTTENIGISGENSFSESGEHTVTFTGVTTSMTSITIVFTPGSNNVRLDDIVLKGSAQAVTVEAPTFSINGGTYYTAQSVELSCATDGATIYYSTDNTNWTEYTTALTISTTTTLYAKAIKGTDESTVSSATYTIAEKNIVVFNITDKSLAYGETYTITKGTNSGRDVQTDGNVTLATDNSNVASVSGLAITANAVGTATITINAAEGDTYKVGSKTITVTVTAPTGNATVPDETIFEETFANCTGSCTSFSGSDGSGMFTADNTWEVENAYGAGGSAKFGANSKAGKATTPAINATEDTQYTLTFKAAPWNTETTTMNVSVTGGTISGVSTDAMTTGEWNNFTATITASAETFTITFEADKNRFFLDEVKVTKASSTNTATVTLNKYGYATYCSVNPIDFSSTTGYTAWRVSSVSGSTITFEKITETIKGGQGVLLYNKDADGENTSEVTINFANGSTEFTSSENKLVGTLAPTYVIADDYYGLSGNQFKKVSAGTVPAGKALLPASAISSQAQQLTFSFEDGSEATGIEAIENAQMTDGNVYNLNGQRVAQPTKGLYIVNGKKYVIK